MPEYNVEHNGKWACYSSISDSFKTAFMPKAEYEQWLLTEYGRRGFVPVEGSKMNMSIEEAVCDASTFHTSEEVIDSLVEAGIERDEASKLFDAHKDIPDPDDKDDWRNSVR